MNAFVRGIGSNSGARTRNGAATLATSGDPIVDLFFVIGASRGMQEDQFTSMFEKAYVNNPEIALRLSLYARDIRGGLGERLAFRRILLWLEKNQPEELNRVLPKVAEVGRFDDLLIFNTSYAKGIAFRIIAQALSERNGLAAKWMPRKGIFAYELRTFLGLTPKKYRKLLVTLTNVVETKMCAKDWESINLEHVPSVATSRYRKAFARHIPQTVTTFVEKVKKGEAKVHASAVFPHDVLKTITNTFGYNKLVDDQCEIQWEALPDYVGEGSFIPIVDTSASMTWTKDSNGVMPMHVAMSLAMYLSERNKSAFKNLVCNFSDNASFTLATGPLRVRWAQISRMNVGGSTNLQSAFKLILDHAKKNDVQADDMPKTLLILSDMEFNSCVRDLTNYEAMAEQFEMAGYEMPNVVFWNVNGREKNSPVDYQQNGTALVSGFSPSIMRTVLSAKVVRPIDIVLEAVMVDRYALVD